ncbi:hypothetical protein I7I53_12030 [Histoplasma capsulatum var. duboisii H88]|uniref:Uncharacterized protein n=1 Tax=Ajellomyces capsulatus (strain H88) TaxID=544711 RepID=A0A8A1LV12_AJEC8|nr:hypothetical protein I7I53_12030 [Histoplasma capsulatum var. duboisii H88]
MFPLLQGQNQKKGHKIQSTNRPRLHSLRPSACLAGRARSLLPAKRPLLVGKCATFALLTSTAAVSP